MKHRDTMRSGRRGAGVLFLSISVLLVTLLGVFATASRGSWVLREDHGFTGGRAALAVARSALAEAEEHVRAEVNREGTGWYRAVRENRTSASGMRWWLTEAVEPELTRTYVAGESGVSVEPVRVSVWRDFAFDPANGPFDEKYGVLSLTADVGVPEGGMNPFRGSLRRQLQHSYHVKQTRVSAPPPFGRWTLYVDRVPQLETEKAAYSELLRRFAERRRKLEDAYRKEIDGVIIELDRYLAWMRKKVDDIADTRKLIRKTADELATQEAMLPLSMGLAAPAVAKLAETLADLKKGLEVDIRNTLTAFGLPDEDTFTKVALSPYPPANLRADIRFALARGDWPAFRRFTPSDDGLTGKGEPLANPVITERDRVSTSELDYRLPAPPELPVRPTYSLASRDIDWTARYDRIAREFTRFKREYDAGLAAFAAAYAAEFQRHESVFQVLATRPPEFERVVGGLADQARRSSQFHQGEAAFLDTVAGPDGTAGISGVHAVRGDLSRLPPRFRGRGMLVVEGNARLGRLEPADERSTLVVLCGRSATIEGRCDAGVYAPRGRIISKDPAHVVRHAIAGEVTRADQFTVERSPRIASDAPDGLWFTIAPVRVGEALLRH